MQALVAVMRKLLHAIFGMFKHHQPYDGSKLFPGLPARPCLTLYPRRSHEPQKRKGSFAILEKRKTLEIQERIYQAARL